MFGTISSPHDRRQRTKRWSILGEFPRYISPLLIICCSSLYHHNCRLCISADWGLLNWVQRPLPRYTTHSKNALYDPGWNGKFTYMHPLHWEFLLRFCIDLTNRVNFHGPCDHAHHNIYNGYCIFMRMAGSLSENLKNWTPWKFPAIQYY